MIFYTKAPEVAEKKAAETLNDVREAMKINYFDGDFALN